jgi:hypothetical protein
LVTVSGVLFFPLSVSSSEIKPLLCKIMYRNSSKHTMKGWQLYYRILQYITLERLIVNIQIFYDRQEFIFVSLCEHIQYVLLVGWYLLETLKIRYQKNVFFIVVSMLFFVLC